MKKLFVGALATAMASTAGHAVVITEGGTADAASGLTTSQSGPNISVETFDLGGGAGCGPTLGETISGDFSISNTSVNGVRAAPAGDSTCYFAVPSAVSSGQASVDFTPTFNTGTERVSYLGLYWGSIDLFNAIDFYDGSDLLQTITGADVLDALTLSGNQSAPGSNKYINLFFEDGEEFTSFTVRSTSYAFEIDNVALGVIETPEPGALGLLGLGLLGIAGYRRRKA